MKAYWQNADGSEKELEVTRTDPEDGTHIVHFEHISDYWIRLVPEQMTHFAVRERLEAMFGYELAEAAQIVSVEPTDCGCCEGNHTITIKVDVIL